MKLTKSQAAFVRFHGRFIVVFAIVFAYLLFVELPQGINQVFPGANVTASTVLSHLFH